MRLEYLRDMELAYREEPFGDFVLVRPYGGEEGAGYGQGDGTVKGEKLRGSVRWVNHPRRRSDGSMLPNAHSVIRTDDGAQLLFSLQGRTAWVDSGGRKIGRQILVALSEAEDRRYRWLNDVLCVLDGAIDPENMRMRSRIHTCISELV